MGTEKPKKKLPVTKEIIDVASEPNAYSKRVCDMIKNIVCNYYELPISVFSGRSRKRVVIKAKQSSVYFIRKALPKATLLQIGKEMDYDHSTVLHCIKTINNLLETDKETQADISAMERTLQLERDAVTLQGDIERDYYYINMADCISVKLPDRKAIVLSRFTQEEALFMLQDSIFLKGQIPSPVEHKNTGLFILQKNKKEDDKI